MTVLSERLRPASEKQGNAELLACLILVAPSGMTGEDRDAWLRAAKMTLSGIPGDLLQRGCEEARKRCRFASEIVPSIFELVESEWDRLKSAAAIEAMREANRDAPRLEQPKPEYVTVAEMRQIVREVAAERRA